MSSNMEEATNWYSLEPIKDNSSGVGNLSQSMVSSFSNTLQKSAVWNGKQNQELEHLPKMQQHTKKRLSRNEGDGQNEVFSRSYHSNSEYPKASQFPLCFLSSTSAQSTEAEGTSSTPVVDGTLQRQLEVPSRCVELDCLPLLKLISSSMELDRFPALDGTALGPTEETTSRVIPVSPSVRPSFKEAMQNSELLHHRQNRQQNRELESCYRNNWNGYTLEKAIHSHDGEFSDKSSLEESPEWLVNFQDSGLPISNPMDLEQGITDPEYRLLLVENSTLIFNTQDDLTRNRDPVYLDARGNTSARSSEAEGTSSVTRKLLVSKLLTKTDVESDKSGIILPQKQIREHFGTSLSENGLHDLTLHDGVQEGTIWIMQLTAYPQRHGNVYKLKNTLQYTKDYSLQEGDLLQIYLEEPDHRYVLIVDKHLPKFMPPSVEHSLINSTEWKLIIRKQLTKTDVTVGPKSRGCICLGIKKVEEYFPKLEKEGLSIDLYDWDSQRTWRMTLKPVSHTRGRMYRLHDTGEYSKCHSLQERNWLHIYKSDLLLVREPVGKEPSAKYSLKTGLLPLS